VLREAAATPNTKRTQRLRGVCDEPRNDEIAGAEAVTYGRTQQSSRMPRALLNFEKRALLSMTLSGLRLLGNSVVVYFLFVVRSKRGS
jgi:hypothetical protein